MGTPVFSYLKAGSLKDLSEHTADDVLNDLWKNIETVSKHSGGSGIFFDWDRMNVLIPHDLTKLPKESDIVDCCNALRLIYPSEIKIRSIINLIVQDEQYLSYGGSTTYDFYPHLRHAEPFEHYLIFYERQRKQVNQLLRLYRERVESHDYIKSAMEFYVAGWQENNPLMAFVCFCIAMEGIVSSDEQLTFRFRRNLAVLIGESAFFSKIILKNAKNLYDMRSKIVHSGVRPEYIKNLDSYLEYAKALSSRMIIEMILHNITIDVLDEKLTELGFGDHTKISQNYKPIIANLKMYSKLFDNLPPLKKTK